MVVYTTLSLRGRRFASTAVSDPDHNIEEKAAHHCKIRSSTGQGRRLRQHRSSQSEVISMLRTEEQDARMSNLVALAERSISAASSQNLPQKAATKAETTILECMVYLDMYC